MDNQCKYFCKKDSMCHRWMNKRPCSFPKGENYIFDSDVFDTCEKDEICQVTSPYGNDYIFITDEDIEALKSGKILYTVDEYGTFLAYKKENDKPTIHKEKIDSFPFESELKTVFEAGYSYGIAGFPNYEDGFEIFCKSIIASRKGE